MNGLVRHLNCVLLPGFDLDGVDFAYALRRFFVRWGPWAFSSASLPGFAGGVDRLGSLGSLTGPNLSESLGCPSSWNHNPVKSKHECSRSISVWSIMIYYDFGCWGFPYDSLWKSCTWFSPASSGKRWVRWMSSAASMQFTWWIFGRQKPQNWEIRWRSDGAFHGCFLVFRWGAKLCSFRWGSCFEQFLN